LETLENRVLMSVTEFPIPDTTSARPEGITRGPDGNLWFTEAFADRIGRITPAGVVTQFSLPFLSQPAEITAGPDGNLWFTETNSSRIGRITPAGVITEFSAGITPNSRPAGITRGPDGNVWFTETQANKIGRITPAGVVTEFSAGITPNTAPTLITAGPDGNLWFTQRPNSNAVLGAIGSVTPAGVITEFSAGLTQGGQVNGITTGPDGNLWFTELNFKLIGRITPAGVITEAVAIVGSSPDEITTGPDGNLWFTEFGQGRIGRLTTAGAFTEFAAGISIGSNPFGITAGPDGNIWFAEASTNNRPGDEIGRLNLAQSPAETMTTLRTSATTIGFGQTLTLTATVTALGGGLVTNGTVDFFDGNARVASVPLDANGVATVDVSGGGVGIHGLRANLHSGAFPASSSAVVNVTVTSAAGITASFSNGVLTIIGDAQDNTIVISRNAAGTILVNNGAIAIQGGPATVANTSSIQVSGGLGNDNLSLNETNGPLPGAIMTGDGGNDTLTGGSGADTFIGNPGDGDDVIEGQGGQDKLVFNGTDLAEKIEVSANGTGVRITRYLDGSTLNAGGVEEIDVNPLGGADTVTVDDLSGTPVTSVRLNLAATVGGADADNQPDSVVINGRDASDSIPVTGTNSMVQIGGGFADGSGLPYSTAITSVEPGDSLRINGNGGNDTINASVSTPVKLSIDGGAQHDTINVISTVPGIALVRVLPSSGDDAVSVGASAHLIFDAEQRIGPLSIASGGSATLVPGRSASLTVTSLDIAGAGRLDVNDNDLIVDYSTTSPIGAVQSLLAAGYHGGAWDGNGISTSLGNASTFALGVAEASDVTPGGTFDGQAIDHTAVIVKFTLYGDANLDGSVNIFDLNPLLAHLNRPGSWTTGDFNYNNQVDIFDLSPLLANYNHTLPAASSVIASLAPPVAPRAATALEARQTTTSSSSSTVVPAITLAGSFATRPDLFSTSVIVG
jgi:streptogramin lyase